MVKVAFFVVLGLAIILNVVGWIAEKVYKNKVANQVRKQEFDVYNRKV
ncbi:MAG: hypothetical protein HFJ26_01175 [Clostridia bacterium]|nr:hypothetical protein [Clostridia bacterium]